MSSMKDSENLKIPFGDIKVATKNFKTIIGRGGYGPVYKGELTLSGDHLTSVAVKRLPNIAESGRANEDETYLITNAGGTFGYCDPVYIKTGILTKKSDVYSFGAVLFEALCGRLCFMNVIGEQRHLVPLARRCYEEGKLNEIMDLDLKDSESVREFSEVAYQCLHDDQERRPSMDVVLQKLEKVLELLEYEEACESQKLEEALQLQIYEEALEFQKLEEALRLQEYEEACELRLLEEALGLQKLVETLQLLEFDDALEMQELMEALELYKLGDMLNLEGIGEMAMSNGLGNFWEMGVCGCNMQSST
ncbi:hypothetical protein L2E82_49150 [Cichorium intybus]|uniref:Uncharacterized protein n=1 Tax=Cichorium intybus TaxID=13427 RepID=A0ACB8YYW0_CICIN|nr:hypothetical protein L2E82_49150 [Cichorium intybus]